MATPNDYIENATLMNSIQFTPQELATLWNVSDRTIKRVFKNEPDVIFHGAGSRRTMRIPERVAIRVYKRIKGK